MGNWYLTGFCREAGAERRFRVDRIRDLEVTDEVFPAPEQLPPPEVRYTPAEDDVVATIRLGPQARWVTEYYEVDNVAEEPDGWSVVRFSAPDPMVAARLLVRLGSAAQLVEGDEVAAATEKLRTRHPGPLPRDSTGPSRTWIVLPSDPNVRCQRAPS